MEAARRQFQAEIPGSQVGDNNRVVAEQSQVLILAVKPQHVAEVVPGLRGLPHKPLVVSIVAGVTLARLSEGLATERIIRAMPNTPCLIGWGAAGYSCGPSATDEDVARVQQLLDAVGLSCQVPERLLDAVTGLSGSGPAFVYQFIEALSDAGVRVGLPRETALRLAAQTVAARRGWSS